MKSFLILCFVALAAADVKHLTDRNLDLFKYNPSDVYTLPEDIDDDKPAVLFSGDVMKAKVEKLQNLNGNKKFKLELKTQNGIEVSSVGKLKDEKTFVVSGSYSFTGADGKRYKTRYTADEFGYHPITELDLDIPEPQPLNAGANQLGANKNSLGSLLGGSKNRFQFLNQNLNLDASQNGPLRGSGQSGDDYSYGPASNPFGGAAAGGDYNSQYGSGFGAGAGAGSDSYSSSHDGYNYNVPSVQFDNPVAPSEPSRQYLPVQ